MPAQQLIHELIETHKLPAHFSQIVEHYYLPLCARLVQLKKAKSDTLYVAINGSQGSGKSTMAAFLTDLLNKIWQLKVANLSIDDFYLTRKERKHLAEHIHPLLMTRGVPGTHDIPLALQTLKKLANPNKSVPVVRFNKAIDDRANETQWSYIDGPVDIVILEGWCMGIEAQSEADLYTPINKLESEEDSNAKWRHYVNDQLMNHYPNLFKQFDYLIMLKAPSFDCVYQWRKRQEDKLKANAGLQTHVMSEPELKRFIEHYQRLTEHALTELPTKANVVFNLDESQHFTQVTGLH
ncbi:hypothetical protein N7931_04210 [Catenovulum sp. 2E275]|uniref:hypothetical protein n=1 Tax=Catenovulum sp. 2E275 TaxID=2980497 RepID=UPI0021D006EF|nr:hypothetical protein [Catenovulum sp. 2E275]MCU4674833.1 hypothetical protein [Catenovulum sp. 2E275]